MRLRPELVVLIVLAGCAHAPPAVAPPPPAMRGTAAPHPSPTPVPVHVTSSGNGRYTTLTQMKNRRIIYTVQARSFEGDTTALGSAGGNGTFDRPHIVFVDRHGGRTIADAPKAVLASADKSVVMTGGVRARSQEGNVLQCDRLRYDGRTETVHGDGHVRMASPDGLTLAGDTLDGDVRLQNVRVARRP
jgi:lipopolysaccharide assembly outer membrane protein LptD (OstA)